MYNTIQEFIEDWLFESQKTLAIFEALTDDSLDKKVWSKGRTLGFLAWHIVLTINEMLSETSLKLDEAADGRTQLTDSVNDIITEYKKSSKAAIDAISANWTDEQLNEELDMYGQKWTKALILRSLIRHQIHHRGQITVLMRQAGLQVPGLYGPSKEEWSKFGMDPQD